MYLATFHGTELGAGVDVQQLAQDQADLRPEGFSADGQYLAAIGSDGIRPQLFVFNRRTGQPQALALDQPLGLAWSPQGHLLAVPGPAGLYVIDPKTGTTQWVQSDHCAPNWYALPTSQAPVDKP